MKSQVRMKWIWVTIISYQMPQRKKTLKTLERTRKRKTRWKSMTVLHCSCFFLFFIFLFFQNQKRVKGKKHAEKSTWKTKKFFQFFNFYFFNFLPLKIYWKIYWKNTEKERINNRNRRSFFSQIFGWKW